MTERDGNEDEEKAEWGRETIRRTHGSLLHMLRLKSFLRCNIQASGPVIRQSRAPIRLTAGSPSLPRFTSPAGSHTHAVHTELYTTPRLRQRAGLALSPFDQYKWYTLTPALLFTHSCICQMCGVEVRNSLIGGKTERGRRAIRKRKKLDRKGEIWEHNGRKTVMCSQ